MSAITGKSSETRLQTQFCLLTSSSVEVPSSILGTFLGIVLLVTCMTRQTGLVTCRPSTARELPLPVVARTQCLEVATAILIGDSEYRVGVRHVSTWLGS